MANLLRPFIDCYEISLGANKWFLYNSRKVIRYLGSSLSIDFKSSLISYETAGFLSKLISSNMLFIQFVTFLNIDQKFRHLFI